MKSICLMFRTILILLCLGLLCSTTIWSQTGINIKAGINSINFMHKDKEVRDHMGTQLGVDIIGEHRKLLYIPGLHYYRTALFPKKNGDQWIDALNHKPNYHGAKVNMYLGTRIINKKLFKWGIFLGGAANFVFATDNNVDNIRDDHYHDVSFGIEGGTSLYFSRITLDIFCQQGFSKVYIAEENSNMRILGINIGVFL